MGTLDEIIDIINRNLLEEIDKKIFLINENCYWEKLINLMDFFKSKNFFQKNSKKTNLTICNFDELKREIKKIDAQNKS